MHPQNTSNSQSNLEKDEQGITLSNFILYYNAIVIKTVQDQHKNRGTDQQNRIESPEINAHIYGQLMYNKELRIHNGKRTVSSVNGAGKTGWSPAKKDTGPLCNTTHKVNSKWIKALDERPATMKLLEKTQVGTLLAMGLGNDVSGFEMKSKNKQMELTQIYKTLEQTSPKCATLAQELF